MNKNETYNDRLASFESFAAEFKAHNPQFDVTIESDSLSYKVNSMEDLAEEWRSFFAN